MRCPFCGNRESKVLDKRETGDQNETTRRRRVCDKCGRRFTTYEKVEPFDLLVIKKDGRKEAFDREKLMKGISRSCEKRQITRKMITDLVDKAEADIRSHGEKEIKSSKIGTIVMRRLKRLDKVAYIRFASVYKEFEDIEEFKRAIDKLEER